MRFEWNLNCHHARCYGMVNVRDGMTCSCVQKQLRGRGGWILTLQYVHRDRSAGRGSLCYCFCQVVFIREEFCIAMPTHYYYYCIIVIKPCAESFPAGSECAVITIIYSLQIDWNFSLVWKVHFLFPISIFIKFHQRRQYWCCSSLHRHGGEMQLHWLAEAHNGAAVISSFKC